MEDGAGDPARTHRDGVRAGLPLSVAVFGFGISFGVLARAAGMGVLAPIVMSGTTFAGSAQFAATSVIERRRRGRRRGRGRGAPERPLRADRRLRGPLPHGAVVVPPPPRTVGGGRVVGDRGGGRGSLQPQGAAGGRPHPLPGVAGRDDRGRGVRQADRRPGPSRAGRRLPGTVPRAARPPAEDPRREARRRARRDDRVGADAVHAGGRSHHLRERRVPDRICAHRDRRRLRERDLGRRDHRGRRDDRDQGPGPGAPGRPAPARARSTAWWPCSPPRLLAALVAINTFATDRALGVDARVLGVGAAAIAIWLRAPVLLSCVVAGRRGDRRRPRRIGG